MIRNVYSNLLYIGDAISARDVKLIYDHELVAVVDLAANESPATLGHDIVYCRFPLHDDGSNDDAMVSAAIGCLHSLLQRQYRTLVACSAGMSRSPSVGAAALSILTGKSMLDCLKIVTTDAPHDISPAFISTVERVRATMKVA